ncbi:MAG: hypothetical protein ABGY41_14315, partial [Candidatus Poribacteria bacterium]
REDRSLGTENLLDVPLPLVFCLPADRTRAGIISSQQPTRWRADAQQRLDRAGRPGVAHMTFELTVLPFAAAAGVTFIFFIALIRDMNHRHATQTRVAERVRAND